MFIETLEFTIPVDLCDIFSTMKRGPQANFEFPASVNSYGTTQDANVQVVLRANKLTFKVDGVSSDASMISKSECRTLKLSVFDVDRSLMPFDENVDYQSNNISMMPQSSPAPLKRVHEQSISVPPAKSSRTSFPESPKPRSPPHRHLQSRPSPRPTPTSQSKPPNHTPVNVKEEPEDPDLIEIEPDPEPEDIEPKTETPYMQIDYSSTGPCTQTSQAALDRLSFPHASQSSSSPSSFQQNVPHVPDYAEPGPSQHARHGGQNSDYLVFQGDEGEDNEGDYSNDVPQQMERMTLLTSQVWPRRPWTVGSTPSPAPHARPTTTDDPDRDVAARGHDHHACLFEECREVLTSEDDLLQHMVTAHADVRSHHCLRCYRRFLRAEGLAAHLQTCRTATPRRTVPCEECGKWFSSNQKKRMHVDAQHRGILHRCVCGQVYAYSTGLHRHRKNTGHPAPFADSQSAGNVPSAVDAALYADPVRSPSAEVAANVASDVNTTLYVDPVRSPSAEVAASVASSTDTTLYVDPVNSPSA